MSLDITTLNGRFRLWQAGERYYYCRLGESSVEEPTEVAAEFARDLATQLAWRRDAEDAMQGALNIINQELLPQIAGMTIQDYARLNNVPLDIQALLKRD